MRVYRGFIINKHNGKLKATKYMEQDKIKQSYIANSLEQLMLEIDKYHEENRDD